MKTVKMFQNTTSGGFKVVAPNFVVYTKSITMAVFWFKVQQRKLI